MEIDFSEVIESEVPKDCVLISVGLPGSWKSPVTEEIAKMKGFQILRSDMIRLEVLKGQDIFDNKVASDPENRKRVYEEMFSRRRRHCRPARVDSSWMRLSLLRSYDHGLQNWPEGQSNLRHR